MLALAAFRNLHRGASIVVCGCGASLNALQRPERFTTIGVNDVGRLFQPDYLVVVDPPARFNGDRFDFVRTSRARYLFTQLADLDVPHPNVVRFVLGAKDGTDLSNPDVLHYSVVTPYVALCLAIHMGAAHVGLIGVDFTDGHFFGPTGTNEWAPHVVSIDQQFGRLSRAALARGVRVFNLSPISRLTSMPHMAIETFASLPEQSAESGAHRPLSIVSYATTPIAGVPATLARCINARTPHRARCVWPTHTYGNGISFDDDVNWTSAPARAKAELEDADVVIVHNGKVAEAHRDLIGRKPIVVMAHNYIWNVERSFVDQGYPGVVVGQYQATLPEFDGWRIVPNPLPIWEEPGKAAKGDVVTIAYTPADRHELYPTEHPLYWHSKGFSRTIDVLDRLATRHAIRLEVVRDGCVSHVESLAMKRRAHILIDECVTGSYHRNSLEGLAAGCVVVNGVGLLAGVEQALRHCAADAPDSPFIRADLTTLENILETLIGLGPDLLAELGRQNRAWLERHWDFGSQWARFWQPVADQAVAVAYDRASLLPCAIRSRRDVDVSVVVVTHNEGEILRRTIDSLRATLPEDSEIVVVDDHSDDGSTDFLDAPKGNISLVRPPQRLGVGRARNFGTGYASGRVVVFSDAHIAVPPDWPSRLAAVLRDPDVGAVGPAIRVMRYPEDYETDTSVTSTEARGYGLRWQGPTLDVAWLPKKSTEPFAAPFLGGGFLAMRRNLFAAVGGFDAGFDRWGSEDIELCLRLWLLGYSCLVVPQVDVAHLFRGSARRYPVQWEGILYNKLRLAAVHFDERRRQRVQDAFHTDASLPAALARLCESDAAARRDALHGLRRHDDQWFFDHFSDASVHELS